MNRRLRFIAITAALFIAGFMLCGYGLWLAAHLPENTRYSLLFTQQQTLNATGYFDKKEPYHYAVASQTADEQIESLQFGRRTSLTLLQIEGDPALILSGQRLISGSYPADSLTCAIDKQSAFNLWGDIDVTGKIIVYNYEEYVVSGVLESSMPMLIMRPSAEINFNFALFSPPENKDFPRKALEDFLSQEGLSAPAIVKNTGEENRMLRQIALFPLLIPCASLLWVFAHKTFKNKKILRRLVFLAGTIFCGYVLGIRPFWPQEYMPTRWSDFSFWGNITKQAQLNRMVKYMNPGFITEYMHKAEFLAPIAVLAAASACCFIAGFCCFAVVISD